VRRGEGVALCRFEQSGDDIRIAAEKHYRLVPPKEVSAAGDLEAYRRRGVRVCEV